MSFPIKTPNTTPHLATWSVADQQSPEAPVTVAQNALTASRPSSPIQSTLMPINGRSSPINQIAESILNPSTNLKRRHSNDELETHVILRPKLQSLAALSLNDLNEDNISDLIHSFDFEDLHQLSLTSTTLYNHIRNIASSLTQKSSACNKTWTLPLNFNLTTLIGKEPTSLSKFVHTLDLSSIMIDSKETLQTILNFFPNITNLDIVATPEIAHHLVNFPNIQLSLSIPNDVSFNEDITDARLACLADLKNLKSLNLKEGFLITDAGLKHLRNLSNLQYLNLDQCTQITDAGLRYLSHLENLQHLDLSECENITDVGSRSLCRLINLEHLVLQGCPQITDEGVGRLTTRLTKLKTLDLADCNITNDGLASIGQLTTLTNLNLCNCDPITNDGLGNLSGLTNLEKLNIDHCNQVTPNGLSNLRGLTKLKDLKVSWLIGNAARIFINPQVELDYDEA